jgi:hypothetical protein
MLTHQHQIVIQFLRYYTSVLFINTRANQQLCLLLYHTIGQLTSGFSRFICEVASRVPKLSST